MQITAFSAISTNGSIEIDKFRFEAELFMLIYSNFLQPCKKL